MSAAAVAPSSASAAAQQQQQHAGGKRHVDRMRQALVNTPRGDLDAIVLPLLSDLTAHTSRAESGGERVTVPSAMAGRIGAALGDNGPSPTLRLGKAQRQMVSSTVADWLATGLLPRLSELVHPSLDKDSRKANVRVTVRAADVVRAAHGAIGSAEAGAAFGRILRAYAEGESNLARAWLSQCDHHVQRSRIESIMRANLKAYTRKDHLLHEALLASIIALVALILSRLSAHGGLRARGMSRTATADCWSVTLADLSHVLHRDPVLAGWLMRGRSQHVAFATKEICPVDDQLRRSQKLLSGAEMPVFPSFKKRRRRGLKSAKKRARVEGDAPEPVDEGEDDSDSSAPPSSDTE